MMKLWLFFLLWSSSWQSELTDLLSTTDRFFQEFDLINSIELNVDDFKHMVKRTFKLSEDHKIFKRSIDNDENEKGVYLLNNIIDVAKIPAKFPNDINIFSAHNLLFVITLESNGTNPETQLANNLVLYQYSPIHGIKEIGRMQIQGGIKSAVHTFKKSIFIITAEHEAQNSFDTFKGSTLYKMTELRGRIILEKIQILNVIEPNDVQFWEHQDNFYLAIASNMGNDSLRTGILIYKWTGHHFNCIQRISGKYVKSIKLFTMGSFVYLAIANYQDEYGNTDIFSDIYKFNLNDLKFYHFQSIKTHGAQNIVHFNFENSKLKKDDHFLAVANYIGKNKNGALTSNLESIIYKFNGKFFIPFQSFRLLAATKWLPIKGSKGEFLLLVVYAHGLKGYQYDGWRFSQVSLQFGQSLIGTNIQSMRAFQYLEDIFLTTADKNSFGENVNLWKLLFSKKNDLEEMYKEAEFWCEKMKLKMLEDNFTSTTEEFKWEIQKTTDLEKLRILDLKEEAPENKIRNEISILMNYTKVVNDAIEENSEKMENDESEENIFIILGSKNISNVELQCVTEHCVTFKNLKIVNANKENFSDFLSNILFINKDITETDIDFENLAVSKNLFSNSVNEHEAATLVDVTSETFVNSELVVNGTVFINNDLNVYGLFDGIQPDRKNFLLYDGDQLIDGKLIVKTLRVKNLKLSGTINRHNIKDLLRQQKVELQTNYEELNVNNLVIEGLINGHNITHLLNDAVTNSGNQNFQGNLQSSTLEANEIIIEDEIINNMTVKEFIVSSYCKKYSKNKKSESISNVSPDRNPKSIKLISENSIIIVENVFKAKDIVDKKNHSSLFNIIKNGYQLNETVIDSSLNFSTVKISDDFQVEAINNCSVESWLLKNSTVEQFILGKKTFFGNFYIEKKVSARKVNDINLQKLSSDVFNLKINENVLGNWKINTLTCHEIKTNDAPNFQNFPPFKLNQLKINEKTVADTLKVDYLSVSDAIDGVDWENFLNDSILNPVLFIPGEKVIDGTLRIKNFNLKGHINNLSLNENTNLNSKSFDPIVLHEDLVLSNPLTVDELKFENTIDSILKPNFTKEWLIQNEMQIISVPFSFENIQLKLGASLKNETINKVNLRKMFARSIKINENTKVKLLYGTGQINANKIDIGETLNGAHFSDSILRRSKSNSSQVLSGECLFENGLNIHGSLVIEGFVSGLNISHLCRINPRNKINLVVGGSVKFKKEPKIRYYVNGFDVFEISDNVWMKNEKTTLKGLNNVFENIAFENRTILLGSLNNLTLNNLSKYYLSKTLNRVISQDFSLEKIIIKKCCRARKAFVNGYVNGINFSHWANNVLLQNEKQTIQGKLKFNTFEAKKLNANGTINNIDILKDILRYDLDNVTVVGEKTFENVRVLNLSITRGNKIQGVDIDDWRKSLMSRRNDSIIYGDVILDKAEFLNPITVLQKVNNITFDSQHLLKTTGNQIISGIKFFKQMSESNVTIGINNLKLFGLIDGLDFDTLIKSQAYSDRDLIFTEPQSFSKGISVKTLEINGSLQNVNISSMCHNFFNPVDVNEFEFEYDSLLNKTKTLIEIVKGRAFFFSHFELIQTLKPNIKAVVPAVENKGHYLAVFTSKTMKLMNWNEYSENFINAGDILNLKENVTFVTSEFSTNESLLYIEDLMSTKVIYSDLVQQIDFKYDTSCITSFQLKPLNKSCIFIGQKKNSSVILCKGLITQDLRTYQWLESKGSVQATALTINEETYLAVINKEIVVDKIENSLVIYRFDSKLHHFYETHTLAEVNPVAVSSVTYKGNYYLVAAGGHLPESVHNSVISIFKFNKNYKVFVRFKSIRVDTPVDVHFALLPSKELALYVLTSSPTKPFVVFLHRGVAGFVEETSGLSLYPGSHLYSFTDSKNRHFVIINGLERGQILKAGFKGDKTAE